MVIWIDSGFLENGPSCKTSKGEIIFFTTVKANLLLTEFDTSKAKELLIIRYHWNTLGKNRKINHRQDFTTLKETKRKKSEPPY